MQNRMPTLTFYCDVPACTTQRIRSMVKQEWISHRTLRIIGMKKLEKITSVEGVEFMKAWLQCLICHEFLWNNFVEHGDPSLSNLMYDPDLKCGVLSDYDLSLQWEPRVPGTDRTGTVPFMSIDLLTEDYWKGNATRHYHHELESFMWILGYVHLLYKDQIRQSYPKVDKWRTSDYELCQTEKLAFIGFASSSSPKVQPSFQKFWAIAEALFAGLSVARVTVGYARVVSKQPYVPATISERLWDIFDSVFEDTLLPPKEKTQQEPIIEGEHVEIFKQLVLLFKKHQPSFQPPSDIEKNCLSEKYGPILHPDYATGSAFR